MKINSTGEIKEVKQVGDKLFDKENNCYLGYGWEPREVLLWIRKPNDNI